MRPNTLDRYLGVTLAVESALGEGDYDAVRALLDSRGEIVQQLEAVSGLLTPNDWELIESTDAHMQQALKSEKNLVSREMSQIRSKAQAIKAYARS